MTGLVKRVPVYQAPMDSNPLKGDIQRSTRGKLTAHAPSFQADSGKDMIGNVKVGGRTTKSRSMAAIDVQNIKQKAGLTNKGYGI